MTFQGRIYTDGTALVSDCHLCGQQWRDATSTSPNVLALLTEHMATAHEVPSEPAITITSDAIFFGQPAATASFHIGD